MSIDKATLAPVTPGHYLFTCGENDNTPEEIEIIEQERVLIVLCPHLGRTALELYHNNLTSPRWVKLS